MIQIYFSIQIITTQNNILLEIYFSMIQLKCSLIWSSDPGGTVYLSQPALPSGEGESEEGGREGLQQHISIAGVTDRPVLRGCTGKPKIRKLVCQNAGALIVLGKSIDTLGMRVGLQQANVDYTEDCLACVPCLLMQTSDA